MMNILRSSKVKIWHYADDIVVAYVKYNVRSNVWNNIADNVNRNVRSNVLSNFSASYLTTRPTQEQLEKAVSLL